MPQVQAAPLTPADALMYKSAFLKLTYPTIFSGTVAGYVDSIGEGVTKVKVGDRVVSGTGIWTSKGDPKFGGLQRFTVVEEMEVIEVSPYHSVKIPRATQRLE
jgi:NADPH:quinone reductase-like Zn-dependent oxidoreductase